MYRDLEILMQRCLYFMSSVYVLIMFLSPTEYVNNEIKIVYSFGEKGNKLEPSDLHSCCLKTHDMLLTVILEFNNFKKFLYSNNTLGKYLTYLIFILIQTWIILTRENYGFTQCRSCCTVQVCIL